MFFEFSFFMCVFFFFLGGGLGVVIASIGFYRDVYDIV